MKRPAPALALVALCAAAHGRMKPERVQIENVYKAMETAYEHKDLKGYTSNWAPAIRWIPSSKAASSTLVRSRADLMRDLRVEFSTPDRVAQTHGYLRFDTEPERATVDLVVNTTRAGSKMPFRSVAERHHWLKAGGRWWLSRIEALG